MAVKAIDRVDAFQRAHGAVGFPLAVIYTFFDDRGAYLAALVAYYGFVSLFPLLLLFLSSLGFFLQGNAHLQHQLTQSALANFPVIGTQLRNNVSGYRGSGTGLAVGIIGTLYGGLGVMQAAQTGFNQMYGGAALRATQPSDGTATEPRAWLVGRSRPRRPRGCR